MMTTEMLDRREFDLLTRLDFYSFVQRAHAELNPGEPFLENWHVEFLCSELMAVWRGDCRRLIVNLPPRNLKSLCISVAFVAWALGHDPTRKIVVVSYGQELAEKLARDTRQVMSAAWYLAIFQATRLGERTSAHDFETTRGGGRMAVSRGGPITGRGADMLIVDDPIKADEAFSENAREGANATFASSLLTRVNKKTTGQVIVAHQRLHEGDLTGHLLKSGTWRHFSLAAIAMDDEEWTYQTPFGARTVRRAKGDALHPEREPLWALEELRAELGEFTINAQYQQAPIPMTGNVAPIDKFRRYEASELPAYFDEVILSLDTAFKDNDRADYTVCTHWGRRDKWCYLLCVWRWKATYYDLKVKLKAIVADHRPQRILIEDCASGQPLIQELQREGFSEVTACQPKGDKVVRMMQAAILIEAGQVFIPANASWLGDYLHELAAFPESRHDDQVDSTSQALNWFRAPRAAEGWLEFYKERSEIIRGIRPPPADGSNAFQ
jgi:predicted phage terminase large subunit-like protein